MIAEYILNTSLPAAAVCSSAAGSRVCRRKYDAQQTADEANAHQEKDSSLISLS